MAKQRASTSAPKSPAKPETSSLNLKQRTFVTEYLIDLNATKAAQRAGYSTRTAYSIGQRLLKHVEVAAAIAKATEAREAKAAEDGDTPLQFLLKTMRAPEPVHQPGESPIVFMARYKAWQEDRLKAAIAAAPYTHNRLTAVEHSTPTGKPMEYKVSVGFVGVDPTEADE